MVRRDQSRATSLPTVQRTVSDAASERSVDHTLHTVAEPVATGQSRERIVAREVLEPSIQFLPSGHITDHGAPSNDHVLLVE